MQQMYWIAGKAVNDHVGVITILVRKYDTVRFVMSQWVTMVASKNYEKKKKRGIFVRIIKRIDVS